MNSNQRRNKIAEVIKRNGNVLVDDLVKEYNVSVETIRRDLRILDVKGILQRTYGGATRREQTTYEMPYLERIYYNYEKKEAIAKAAIKLMENGDSLFLDGNTTGMVVSRQIPLDLELMIVTNSVMIASHITKKGGRSKVFLVGGEMGPDGMTTGHKFYQELKQYRFDKAMFSCMGITPQGIYYSKIEPLRTAHSMAELSNSLILLADSSKLNRTGFLFGMEAKRIEVLVTDDGVPLVTLDKLRELIPKVIVVETSGL